MQRKISLTLPVCTLTTQTVQAMANSASVSHPSPAAALCSGAARLLYLTITLRRLPLVNQLACQAIQRRLLDQQQQRHQQRQTICHRRFTTTTANKCSRGHGAYPSQKTNYFTKRFLFYTLRYLFEPLLTPTTASCLCHC